MKIVHWPIDTCYLLKIAHGLTNLLKISHKYITKDNITTSATKACAAWCSTGAAQEALTIIITPDD